MQITYLHIDVDTLDRTWSEFNPSPNSLTVTISYG